jgi:hypothetical protein
MTEKERPAAWREGAAARTFGKSFEDNPYIGGERWAWEAGWEYIDRSVLTVEKATKEIT